MSYDRPMRVVAAAVVVCSSLLPALASAHIGLDAPTSRYGPDALKPGPCGSSDSRRSANVTYYEPGETIEVRWDEYIDHPGHYRIAFDADGDDDFVDPKEMMELYSNDAVLLDGISDKGYGERDYVATVTLPDIECDNCTLQVIQVMYDKPPYETPGNDIYYQCADLVLIEGGEPPPGDDAGGCSVRPARVGSAGILPILLILMASRLAERSRLHQ